MHEGSSRVLSAKTKDLKPPALESRDREPQVHTVQHNTQKSTIIEGVLGFRVWAWGLIIRQISFLHPFPLNPKPSTQISGGRSSSFAVALPRG